MISKKLCIGAGTLFILSFFMIVPLASAACWWGRCEDELPFNFDIEIDQNITVYNITVNDTNATTECGDNEVLDGSGTCLSLLADWNYTYNVSYEWFDNTTIFLAYNLSYEWFNNATIFQTYNATYDAGIIDTDTNASTACSGDQVLIGGGVCLTLADGWNVTNTTQEILDVINATEYYNFTARNATDLICSNCIGGTEIDESALSVPWSTITNPEYTNDTNTSTACTGADEISLSGDACLALQDGWNRTDQGNTSAQIILAINTTGYYQIQVKNATQAVNASYEYWTNETLMRRDNVSYEWYNNATIFQVYNLSYEWYNNATIFYTYNESYDSNIDTANTTQDILDVCNVTEYFNLTAKNASQVYNQSYDAMLGHNTTTEIQAAVDADTNASTACSGDAVLIGGGVCLSFVDGWNRTDQGNTSAQMITAINTTEYYQITSKNSSQVVNSSYEYQTNLTLTRTYNETYDFASTADTNATTQCGDNEVLDGSGTCLSLLTDWNITYNVSYDSTLGSNTSSEILALIPADTNATSICGDNEILGGGGTCLSLLADWNITYNISYDSMLGSNTTEEIQDAAWAAAGEGLEYNDAGDSANFDCSEVTDSNNDHMTCATEDLVVDIDHDLDMNNYNLTYVRNITISDGTTPDAFIYWNGTNLIIEG